MNDTENKAISLFPSWRQAVQDFLREFKYGDLVTHDWLVRHFDMPTIDDAESMTAKDFQARQFEWLQNVESFKLELLRDHQICLQSVRGEGFRWIPPYEQTRVATDAFGRDARRAFRSAGEKLRNIRITELTEEQRKENMDAIAKLAAIEGMHRKAIAT